MEKEIRKDANALLSATRRSTKSTASASSSFHRGIDT